MYVLFFFILIGFLISVESVISSYSGFVVERVSLGFVFGSFVVFVRFGYRLIRINLLYGFLKKVFRLYLFKSFFFVKIVVDYG